MATHVAAGLVKSETRRPNYWGAAARPREGLATQSRKCLPSCVRSSFPIGRAPPWLRDREGDSSRPFVATSARWALAASLRKALLEEENGSDPVIRQAALRCAVAALKRATPATLDVLLAHQLPRALAARITGDDALSAAKALALFLEPPYNGHWRPPSPFPLSIVGDEDDDAALRSADGVSTSVRERFALRRRVEKAVAEAVGDDAQSEPARGLSQLLEATSDDASRRLVLRTIARCAAASTNSARALAACGVWATCCDIATSDTPYASGLSLAALGAMAKADALAPDATLQAVEAAKQVLNGGSDDARVLSAATGLLDGALRASRSRADAHAKAKNEDEDALKGPNAVATAVLKAAAAPKALQAVWRVLTYESPRIEHATDSMETDDDGRGSRELASCTIGWSTMGARRYGLLDAPLRLLTHSAALVPLIGARLTAAKLWRP